MAKRRTHAQLARSVEMLGRMIEALQRQLDRATATRRRVRKATARPRPQPKGRAVAQALSRKVTLTRWRSLPEKKSRRVSATTRKK